MNDHADANDAIVQEIMLRAEKWGCTTDTRHAAHAGHWDEHERPGRPALSRSRADRRLGGRPHCVNHARTSVDDTSPDALIAGESVRCARS
jgi:hypothetical protein